MIRFFYPKTLTSTSVKREHFVTLTDTINRWYRTRGPMWTVDRVKLTRLALLKYMTGTPLPQPAGLSLDRSGLPTVLKPFKAEIDSNNLRVISAVYSVLTITKVIKGGKPVNPSTLTDKSSMTVLPDWVSRYMQDFVKDYRLKPFDPSWKEFHFTTKSGPNGPALATSLLDYKALSIRQKELIRLIGGEKLSSRIDELEVINSVGLLEDLSSLFYSKPVERPVLAKISVKPDLEGKSRLFGILDYWTQTSLREIHLNLFNQMKGIPIDKTFNQTQALLDLEPTEGSSFHSIDLTAATDRFPVLLQEAFLSELIGTQKAKAWLELLTDRDYYLSGKPLRYGAGQPMGVYSSWAVFALCHHFVVYSAARLVNDNRFFNRYILLGDDIVVADDRVADQYKLLISELGCEFSEQKTHRSKHFFEFAKRLVYQGVEFSPFPLAGLLEVATKYHYLLPFLDSLKDRGFTFDLSFRNPALLTNLFSIFKIYGRKSVSLVRKMEALAAVPKGKNVSAEQAGESMLTLARLFNFTAPCRPLSTLGLILSNHMRDAYGWATARSAEKAFNQVIAWQRKAADELEIDLTPGSDGQSELGEALLRSAPPVAVTSYEAQRAMDLIEPESFSGPTLEWVWDKSQHTRMLILPTAEGLIPTRKDRQMMESRAMFVNQLVKHIHAYREGRRIR
jgi:hypothetical protein